MRYVPTNSMWGPWKGLRQIQREMDRLLGEFPLRRASAFPPVNIWTNEQGALVTAELPGVEADSLDVTATGNTLTVRGQRDLPDGEDGRRWHRRERRGGQFTRTVELPFNIDGDSVHATYRDGVLTIDMQRPEVEKPRKITVQAS